MGFEFLVDESVGGIRLSHLRLGSNNYKTPTFGLIHTDMKRLTAGSSLLGSSGPSVTFQEIVIDKTKDDLLIFNQSKTERLRQQIKKLAKKRVHNLFQLRVSADVHLSPSLLRSIIDAQAHSEVLSVITIPDPYLRDVGKHWQKAMESALVYSNEFIETGLSYTVMPVVSLDQPIDFVNNKIQWLVDRNERALALRATGQFSPRLRKATELIGMYEDIWIHVWDIKKEYLNVSQVHLLPLNAVDTVSTKKFYPRRKLPFPSLKRTEEISSEWIEPEGVPLKPTQKPAIASPKPMDLFEARALGFLTPDVCITEYGDELECPCTICRKARVMSELKRMLPGKDEKNLLQYHETVSSKNEFARIQDLENLNTIEKYYNSKTLVSRQKEKLKSRFLLY